MSTPEAPESSAVPNPYRGRTLDEQISTASSRRRRRSLSAAFRATPLRTWLVVILVVVSGLGLTASSVAVSSIMKEVLYANVDDDLHDALDTWASDEDAFLGSAIARPPSEYCVIWIYPDSTTITDANRTTLPTIREITIGAPPHTVPSSPDSRRNVEWRVLGKLERDEEGQMVTKIVARSLEREHNLLYGLALVQLTISALVLLIMGLLGYYFIRRALQPLREVERTAGAIAEGDLDRRVPHWPRETEVGQLAAALNKMLARLQESVESSRDKEEQMRRFVGDASHELRTPLTSVRGYTELYRSGATDDVDRVLAKIDDESRRMSLLVEDLLALTRAEGSRLDKRPVDLLETSLAVAGSARAAFPGREVNVVNETSSIPVVDGDPARLHQVLLNLITNGLNHGGPDATVTITLHLEEDDVITTIADDGRGMTPEVSARIFDRFYREDSSRSRASGGSGLGLAIAKSLVEQHGGTISVESAEGEGSTFTIRLPRLQEPEQSES